MEPLHITADQIPASTALTVVPKESAGPKPFIEANTVAVELSQTKQHHIIPTYKDSTPLISHADFVELTAEVVHQVFAPKRISAPQLRVSIL